ncbi:nuclease-related domain-containing protein [Bacillus sp. Bva_UNVM-123]|uniref:nuclease-related domain-containing protein n=1 Tax=Bacillus sp. Bva_UNVM-123 TaxID=2829798 RepID=UPI00391F9BB2
MKPRFEPDELKIFRILNVRMSLSDRDKKKYENLEKGFRGEQAFDEWLLALTCDCIILNNLLLEANNTVFQIDSLLITREKIYLFEVKNYEGDLYIRTTNGTQYLVKKLIVRFCN